MGKIHYRIIVFADRQKQGKVIKDTWTDRNEALKNFDNLKNSGQFKMIVLREEEIVNNTDKNYVGVSKPIRICRKDN